MRSILFCSALIGAYLVAGCAGGASVGPAGFAPSGAPASMQAATPGSPDATPTGATATPHQTPSVAPTSTSVPVASPGITPSPSGSSSPAAVTCLPTSNPPITVATPDAVAATLKSYTIDPAKVFVAGVSAGGAFAVQMHVAFSGLFKGAAIYAGTVFYCSQDSLGLALLDCGGETLPNCRASYTSELANSESYLDRQSAAGTIDPESNLAGQPVYLWSGTQDEVVNHQEMVDVDSEYRHYGANVTFDSTFPANHGWESPDGTIACGTANDPYMIKCDLGSQVYDSEQTWLSLFFGTLNPRNDGALGGSLINFDQTEFGAAADNGLDSNGYLFVPTSCAGGARCGLVVAFHGCRQFQGFVHDDFVTEAGIDEWADTNKIIVMYPYAIASDVDPTNPNGCWDWWGYDGDSSYALKTGTQPAIVYKMIRRVFPGAPQ